MTPRRCGSPEIYYVLLLLTCLSWNKFKSSLVFSVVCSVNRVMLAYFIPFNLLTHAYTF